MRLPVVCLIGGSPSFAIQLVLGVLETILHLHKLNATELMHGPEWAGLLLRSWLLL